MKLSNKLIIFSACACVLAFALLVSAWLKAPKERIFPEPGSLDNRKSEAQTLEAEKNISEPVSEDGSKDFYVLRLEDGRICAFMSSDNGNEILWNSMETPPTLSDEERLTLEKGIYTTSFEEMCFYFESYAS